MSTKLHECYNTLNNSMHPSPSFLTPKEQQTSAISAISEIDKAMIQFIELNNTILLGDLTANPNIWEKYQELVKDLTNLDPSANSKTFNVNKNLKTLALKKIDQIKILVACKKHNVLFPSYKEFMSCVASGSTPFMHAIKTKNVQMIHVLNELDQANVNKESPPGITPMMVAISKGDITMVKLLHELGANMNPSNTVNSLIGLAINIPNIQIKDEIVRYLYAQGAKIDQPDINGMTPMAKAAIKGDVHTMQLLYHLSLSTVGSDKSKSSIDLNRLITIGTDLSHITLPLLSCLIIKNQTAASELLTTWGVNQEAALDIIESIRVAHVWGIGGYSTATIGENRINFLLEGLGPKYAIKMLSEYANDFFLVNHTIKDSDKVIIQRSIENAFPLSLDSDETTLLKIKSGEPIAILGGCENHAVSIVIKDRQLGIYNRGSGKTAEGIEFYYIPESCIDKDMIEMIRNLKTFHPNIHVFNSMIRNLNLRKPDNLDNVVEMHIVPKKPQQVGNCAWVGDEGIFEMLCIFLHIKDANTTVYKDFTSYAREKALREYLRNSHHLDARILKEILEKIIKKSEKSTFSIDQQLIEELRNKLLELVKQS